ncbi:MAG: hypothetical protein ACPGLY_03545 [Rubripirellula sp.]
MKDKFGKVSCRGLSAALVGTVPRCHALGASTSIALILAIAWVWFLGHASVASVRCGTDEIDLGEAITLLENQGQWFELSKTGFEEQDRLDLRSKTIAAWLPAAVDFKSVEGALLALGEESQLHLFSIQEGDRQVGQRVAVLNVSCFVQGSFTALCRFLHRLPTLSQPIDCSELKLVREVRTTDSADGSKEALENQPCRATLVLRIPYAASGTAAWNLMKESGNAL